MKKVAIILILLVITVDASAQINKKIFGGFSASADFGRYNDRIGIEPTIAYQILPKTYLGIGGSILYFNTNNIVYDITESDVTNISIEDKIWYYGGSTFIRFVPFENKDNFTKNLFLQSSIEAMYGNGKYQSNGRSYNYTTENLTPFVSIGYKMPISAKLSMHALLAFKLNKENDSPYRHLVARVGIEF